MTSGGVVVPKIGEEGEKKARKSFFAGVPNGAGDGRRGKGLKAPGSGLVGALTSVWSGVTIPDHVGTHLASPEAARALQSPSGKSASPRRPGAATGPRSK